MSVRDIAEQVTVLEGFGHGWSSGGLGEDQGGLEGGQKRNLVGTADTNPVFLAYSLPVLEFASKYLAWSKETH